MNCLGTNLQEVKDNVLSDVATIIKTNGGEIDTNGIITGLNLEKAAKEIKDYVSKTFGEVFVQHADFIMGNPKNGWLRLEFPKAIESVIQQKLELNRQEKIANQEVDKEVAANNEAVYYMDEPDPDAFPFENQGDELMFDPDAVEIEYNEARNNIHMGIDPDFNHIQNNRDVESGEATLAQYVIYKKHLLSNIQKNLSNFKKMNKRGTDYFNKTVKEFVKVIEELKNQVGILDNQEKDIKVIYADVVNEINYLNNVLDNISVDSFDTTDLLNRLENLSRFFLNKKLDDTEVTQEFKDSNLFLVPNHRQEGYDKMNTEVGELINKWRRKQKELISSILETDPVIQQHIKNGKLAYKMQDGTELEGQETLEKIMEWIENPTDVSMPVAMAYGGGLGGGIFGAIIKLQMDTLLRKRQGETGNILKTMDILIDKIKEKTSLKDSQGNKIHIFEQFIQKDTLGVKTNRLISEYSDEWLKTGAKIGKLLNSFFRGSQNISAKTANYANLLRTMKNNEDFLDMSKLRVFKEDSEINVLYTRNYFIHSNEVMDSYYNELVDKLGKNYVDGLIKEGKERAKEWLETIATDEEISEKIKIENNPFEFVNHFNSENYENPVNGNLFLMPKYAVFFPLTKSRDGKTDFNYFNEAFKDIEKDADKFEFWKLAKLLLTEYINPDLQANGENINLYELPQVQDLLTSEIIRNASLGERGKLMSKTMIENFRKNFSSKGYADLRDSQGHSEKVATGYSNTIERRAKELEKLLKTYSIKELAEIANREGIPYDIDKWYSQKIEGINILKTDEKAKNAQKNHILQEEKKRLAKAIANKRTFSPTDEDFMNLLRGVTSVTDNLYSRKTAKNVADIIQDYVQRMPKETRVKNIEKNLDAYIKRNIQKDTLHGEKDNQGNPSAIGKMLSRRVGNKKFLTQEEKKLQKFLKEEVQNIDKRDDFDFRIEDTEYSTNNGKYFEQMKGERGAKMITRPEIEIKYAEYLGKKAEELGVDRTIGGYISGLISIFVQKALWLNNKSGFKNRWEGATKNLMIASSGRYGFGISELDNAKMFLRGINRDRYLETFWGNAAMSVNRSNKDHALNMKTYKSIVQQFGLIQDKKNEFARAEDYNPKRWRFKFHAMDFAVEIPESHNQGELILSKLQTVKVKNVNGDEHSFFNGETGQFIYKPGTMTLRDEFKTPENIRMWENFVESRGDNNQHLSTMIEIQTLIERTQGNYSDRDIVMLQGSLLGRALMTFKRFYPEHFWQNYGIQEFDLLMGENNFKGRKTVMLESAPVTFTYLAACGALSLSGGLGAVMAIGGVTSLVGKFIIDKFIRQQETRMKIDIESLKLAANFGLEILTRSIDRPLHYILKSTPGVRHIPGVKKSKLANYYFTNTIMGKTWSQKLLPEEMTMTSKDRQMLTESAQEIGQRVTLILGSWALITGLKALALMMGGGDDDEYKEKMKQLEGTMNLILNTAGTLNSQLEEMNNPKALIENITQINLFQSIEGVKRLASKVEGSFKGENDWTEPISVGLQVLPVPLPNLLINTLTPDNNSSFIKDRGVWDNSYWWNDMKKDATGMMDKKLRNRRSQTKDEVYKFYLNKFTEEKEGTASKDKIRAMAKKAAGREMAKSYRKEKGETSKEFLERYDFNEERKSWKNGEANYHIEWGDVE